MIDLNLIEDFFSPEGVLSRELDGFERRPSQLKMARKIGETINEKRILVVEAGTGVGKTFSYLVPAILLAEKEETPVIISTFTKNLQTQIIKNDLPRLEKIWGREIKARLLLGRNNYLCLNRLQFLHQKQDLFPGRLLPQIYLWAEDTETGTYEDWPFSSYPQLWPQIAAEGESCRGPNCPHYEDCFLQKARRECQSADIVVINHHLFFSDFGMKQWEDGGVLPAYRNIIFDEAHHLEQTGINFLGVDFSQKDFTDHLQTTRELLTKLQEDNNQALDYKSLFLVLQGLEEKVQAFFYEINEKIDKQEPRFIYSGWWVDLKNSPEEIVSDLEMLERALNSGEEAFVEDLAAALQDSKGWWKKFSSNLKYLMELPEDDYVFWMEGKSSSLSLRSLPLAINSYLNQAFYPEVESVIFTSATLTVNDSARFFASNMGLPADRTDTLILGSPFDYDQQALLLIPQEMPAPGDPKFIASSTQLYKDLVPVLGPRTLLLFTSYQMLRSFYKEIEEFCAEEGLELFVQGDKPVSRLLKEFKKTPRGVLLGTASFWEGVDLPGEAVTSVMMLRLPFPVPDDPWIKGKARQLQEEGNNPFMELMLPRAVIRFKQGWGRLIRSFADRGLLIVVDRRIFTKTYGSLFQKTLPSRLPVQEGSVEDLFLAAKKFWERAGDWACEVEN